MGSRYFAIRERWVPGYKYGPYPKCITEDDMKGGRYRIVVPVHAQRNAVRRT